MVLEDIETGPIHDKKWHFLLHLLYVLIFMLCAIRVLQNFLLFDSLGPKLRMIKDMMQVPLSFTGAHVKGLAESMPYSETALLPI